MDLPGRCPRCSADLVEIKTTGSLDIMICPLGCGTATDIRHKEALSDPEVLRQLPHDMLHVLHLISHMDPDALGEAGHNALIGELKRRKQVVMSN
jgi:hypothetical protein